MPDVFQQVSPMFEFHATLCAVDDDYDEGGKRSDLCNSGGGGRGCGRGRGLCAAATLAGLLLGLSVSALRLGRQRFP